MIRLAIFDFDGTLVDTITDVGICFNEALRQTGFPQHPLERFGSFAGGNLETVVSKMLPADAVTDDNITKVKTVYRKLYLESPKEHTRPYPGIPELLDRLRAEGIQLAINSNKGQQLIDSMVERIFPAGTFAAVVGYLESRPSKPDPYGVDQICRTCGCTREDAVYIGDGTSDAATAANAKIPCVFVTWGQGRLEDCPDGSITAVAKSAAELENALIPKSNGRETVQ